jgi:hypothetical protein
MKKLFIVAACMAISGCETIGNWADDAGSYLPVLSDERCEHWQCFTDEGKAQSDYNKQMRMQQQQQEQGQGSATMQQGQPAPQPVPPPSTYNPPPEMNPYDNYHP